MVFRRVTYDSLQSPDIFADSLQVAYVDTKPTIGFTVGIVGNLKLSKYFDLRMIPSLGFGERYLDYYMTACDDGQLSFVEIRKNVTSAHIDVPLHVRYDQNGCIISGPMSWRSQICARPGCLQGPIRKQKKKMKQW